MNITSKSFPELFVDGVWRVLASIASSLLLATAVLAPWVMVIVSLG